MKIYSNLYSLNLSSDKSLSPSHLYQVIPVGLKSSQIECLTSFVSRLAQAHCVPVSQLISKSLTPYLERIFVKNAPSRDLKSLFNRSGALNGHGTMAEDFIRVLEVLTLHSDLRSLTLSIWKDIFITKGLLRSKKAWCPLCYQEWQTLKQTVYEPLSWTINEVIVCPLHKIPLQTHCPYCFQDIPWLTWQIRLGYCPNCKSWLGTSSAQEPTIASLSKTLDWELWTAETIGEVLAFTPEISSLAARTHVRQTIITAINQLTEGNTAAFAALLKIPRNTVWGWYKGTIFPSFQALLKISYLLKISLKVLLTQELDCSSLVLRTNVLPAYDSKQRASSCAFDEHQVEQALLNALSKPPELLPTIQEIALSLGLNRRLVTRHFPDLCKTLVAERRQYQRNQHLQSLQKCCGEVKAATQTLHQNGEYPTESRVAQLLSHPGYLRYKQVRSVLRQTRKDLGLDS